MQGIRAKIRDRILSDIVAGVYPLGTRIPTEMVLAREFQTNRMNAHLAIKELESAGIVTRKKRGGTVVRRAVSRAEAMDLVSRASRLACVFCFRGEISARHWNEDTLTVMEQTLKQKGFSLIRVELTSPPRRRTLAHAIRENSQRNVRALTILPDHTRTEIFIRENVDLLGGFPGAVYLLNRGGLPGHGWPFHSVSIDPFSEGMMVGKRLRYLGLRHVVFLSRNGDKQAFWSLQREQGLAMGLHVPTNTTRPARRGSLTHSSSYDDLCRRIRATRRPLVVVAANDTCAAGFIDFAAKSGMVPPRDFSLISFDNDPACARYDLTSVAPPLDRIGAIFGRLITDDSWLNMKEDGVSIRVASRIFTRNTCNLEDLADAETKVTLAG